MTQQMDKGVAPACFSDEISPRPRATPDDWLIKEDGKFFVVDESDGESVSVSDDEIVDFIRLIEWPPAQLTIYEAGAWNVDSPMPSGAEIVMIEGDPDSMAGSLEDLVSFGFDSGDQVDVIYYAWRDEKWRFDASTEKFAQVLPAAEH